MKAKVFRAVVMLVGIGVPSLASAYCAEPQRYSSSSFEGQVSGYIDYLLCLHNEQVGSLNEHARLINQLGDEIDGLRRRTTEEYENTSASIMREIVVKYTAIEAENVELRQRVAELEARMERIEGLIAAD